MDKAIRNMKQKFGQAGVNLPDFIENRGIEKDNATLLDTRCRLNMTYTKCGSCEKTCGEEEKICTRECKTPGCYCISGFAFDEHGNCILESDCPKKTSEQMEPDHSVVDENNKTCPTNFTYLECGTCDESCDGPRMCTMECKKPGCYCVNTAAFNESNGCILKSDCPNGDYDVKVLESTLQNDTLGKKASDENIFQPPNVACKENEKWDSCGNMCESSCKDAKTICPAVCGPGACTCVEGFVRNDDGLCIPQDNCP